MSELTRKAEAANAAKRILGRAIQELNIRLQQNRTGLVYNNGFLHLADDLTAQRIAEPFWEVLADPKWRTVDQEMKEAFDHFDHGQRDAPSHAAMALESTVKISSSSRPNAWSSSPIPCAR